MSPPALGSLLVGSVDPLRLRTWYAEIFGARPDRAGRLDFGPVAMVIDRRDVAARSAEPGRLILNFHVPDARAVESLLVEREAVWVRELEETSWGRIGTVLDPDGNYVQVIDGNGRGQ